MKFVFIVMFAFCESVFAHSSLPAGAQYFVGAQTEVDDLLKTRDCFVEAVLSKNAQTMRIRAVVGHPHEKGELFALGSVRAKYNESQGAFVFQDNSSKAKIKEVVLRADVGSKNAPTQYSASFRHGNHFDPVECRQLSVATTEKLESVKDIFREFDHYEKPGQDDHDHDHGHQH